MKKIIFDKLVHKARGSYMMRPMATPFGVKKARVVFYNTMLGHGVTKDVAQDIMKEASIPLRAGQSSRHVFKSAHLITKGIMRDALKESHGK